MRTADVLLSGVALFGIIIVIIIIMLHQAIALHHSINAIGPAPNWSGRKRKHRSIVWHVCTLSADAWLWGQG
jgi:hypothetical protein